MKNLNEQKKREKEQKRGAVLLKIHKNHKQKWKCKYCSSFSLFSTLLVHPMKIKYLGISRFMIVWNPHNGEMEDLGETEI